MSKPVEVDEVWIQRIVSSINGLQYGSVEIVIHDGRIVQIERTERRRFDSPDSIPLQQRENKESRKTNRI